MYDEQPDGDPHGECAAEISRLKAEVERLDDALTQALLERDEMEERATALADSVGEFLGVDVGEWSSCNDPTRRAMEALYAGAPKSDDAPDAARPGIPESLLLALRLIADEYPDGVRAKQIAGEALRAVRVEG